MIVTAGTASEASEPVPAQATGWFDNYAYGVGLQAYIFGFPYVYLPSLRWSWVTQPKPPGSITPYAPLNHFYHSRDLTDASYRDGGSPNNDTLYSIAWVDVASEPVILSHPGMGERYFTFEIASLDSDNFAYVGTRTTGPEAGSYAVIGPAWEGELPEGVKPLPRSRTNSVLIFGRTLVDGEGDLPAVLALQDAYSLVPLSCWGRRDQPLPERRDVWAPFDAKTDALAEWKTMNRAMTEDPPEARLGPLLKLFASVGVGPGQDVNATSEACKRALIRAAKDGRAILQGASGGFFGREMNHWHVPPMDMGRAGLADEFLLRGAVQCLGGIIANDPEEAVYINTRNDGTGSPLDGGRAYKIRFPPGGLPPVGAFWSITLYDDTFNLTPNPIHRYSIGNRTEGLKFDPDGGLTIRIQRDRPAEGAENWLPSVQSGGYLLILRTYLPDTAILDETWAPPAVEPVPG